jgi:hypothetical protein
MLTKTQAINLRHGEILHHRTLTNADGTPLRARVAGRCKTWKTQPTEFRLPVKRGLKQYFYITENNADEWTIAGANQK